MFFDMPARPSAGIGVVEVQKLVFFLRFFGGAHATLCGDRRGRGAKTRVCFCVFFFCGARATLAEIGVVEVQKLGFLRFFDMPARRGDRRGCKNPRFFCAFAVPARPSAEIGVKTAKACAPERVEHVAAKVGGEAFKGGDVVSGGW